MRVPLVCTALFLLAGPAGAQSQSPGGLPPPAGMTLAQSAAMRFPQPVRAGDLVGRTVLAPVESQVVLGTVRAIVHDGAGVVQVVMARGGFLGVGRRLIAVPLDAMVLLGSDVEVAAFTPKELRRFPTYVPEGAAAVPPDTVLTVGLAKPSH